MRKWIPTSLCLNSACLGLDGLVKKAMFVGSDLSQTHTTVYGVVLTTSCVEASACVEAEAIQKHYKCVVQCGTDVSLNIMWSK